MLACFLVLFAAEWGDLSQLLTISLVAKYDDPRSVFVGALRCAAHRHRPRRHRGPDAAAVHRGCTPLHYLGAAVCLLLAGVTAYELLA